MNYLLPEPVALPPPSQVDFDGPFPLEGGKQVANVATRYLARLVRNAPMAARAPSGSAKASVKCGGAGTAGTGAGDNVEIVGLVVACGPGIRGSPAMRLKVQGQALGVEWPVVHA